MAELDKVEVDDMGGATSIKSGWIIEFPYAYAADSQNSPPEFRATHSEDCTPAQLEALLTTNDSQSLSLTLSFLYAKISLRETTRHYVLAWGIPKNLNLL